MEYNDKVIILVLSKHKDMVTVKFPLEDWVILTNEQRRKLVKSAREVAQSSIVEVAEGFDLNDMEIDITITVEVAVSNPEL